MGLVVIKRRPRRPAPDLPEGDLVLESPPELPEPGGKQWGQMVMMVPMLAGSGAMMLMFTGGRMGGGGSNTTLTLICGGLFGVSMLGMMVTQLFQGGSQPSKREMLNMRRDYLRRLGHLRRGVRKTVRDQKRAMYYRHPDPDTLWSTVGSARVWERRPADGDFGVVRMGLGPQRLATRMIPPETKPIEDIEPLCAAALRRFVSTYAIVEGLPVAIDLRGFSKIYLRGEPARVRGLARAMIAQSAVWHSPEDLLLTFCVDGETERLWNWAKWMPHALHPEKTDALGQIRLVAASLREIEEHLGDIVEHRPRFNPATPPTDDKHIVVLVDGGHTGGADTLATEGGVEGVTVLDLTNAPPRTLDPGYLVMEVDADGRLWSVSGDARDEVGTGDSLSFIEAETLARRLTPLRLSAITGSGGDDSPLTGDLSFTDLLDLGDPYEFDTSRHWAPRPNRDRLRVPIGVGPDGVPVELDLKESAQDGMGPHGLMVGATGSGKSEALRTLVLALACMHSPETLNFVLVDFKGGATFTRMDKMPHTSAIITNLSEELPLVDRMLDAIAGELNRRQELLRSAGQFASLRDYERARAAGAPLAPLPSLMIICDEFSELLTAKPEFIDMFVQIGRVGRSLGVHLLLASQRLEEGRLRGLDTHLSYRVGLRTFSAVESRSVLGVADAYELPRSPGHGYLKFGTEALTRFKAAYVSGVYRRSAAERAIAAAGGPAIQQYTVNYVAPPPEPEAPLDFDDADNEAVGESLLDVLVGRMEGKGVPAHKVWLDPLDEAPTLDTLHPALVTDAERGLTISREDLRGSLVIPVAVVDRPYEQRRDVHSLNLSGAAGHIGMAGGAQTGKSSAVRTVITSLALSHTPREVQIYCLDFGGGSLAPLRKLPHVGGVWQRLDVDQVRRTVSEVFTMLEDRERQFAAEGIDGMGTYRQLRKEGKYAEDSFGDVFLVIDGWLTLRNDFEDLEAVVTQIAQRGLSYGVHVVAAANKWSELRPAIRDLLGSKLEFRLGDVFDSYLGRRGAEAVPEGRPGRGLTPEAMHMLTALPRIDGDSDPRTATKGLGDLVDRVAAAWTGPVAPQVRMLPEKVSYELLPVGEDLDRKGRIPIGIAESNLQPVFVEFDNDPHLIYLSDVETGKSTFMRSLIRSITTRYSAKEAAIILMDYRRSLLGEVPEEYLLKYCSSTAVTTDAVRQIVVGMDKRLPPADITPEQLRARNWWTGPELFVLIDDYDLIIGGAQNPLLPLLEYASQARDIGLHIVLTRRSGGAGRAMYETFINRLRELASPGFQGSAPKDEGVLLGNVKARPLPPGRGHLITRREGVRLVQLAHVEPRI
ncbi:type VII secretion protein EccCa [Phytomonospora endophytica]|uniref:S-DNA-T family DNA segregation ATPase FtsK/SpoIIIE n=1 Tax=Phytomonospora endophytica TaxID=714109 RepID=A0A841FI85_9ACTN|nr:type VII secretion protein EccCa [Phytomonospora endophytica]MBB6032837.1 S-DNA-T family DNA segregation ATPase FtsK/SpoIIIE [Phytomonospora endophytica]GIG65063.1 type VII secretion protein EccC [Phytomonospora endophytica]